MDKKKQTTRVLLTREQNARLSKLTQQTNVPIDEYVREGIELVLERHRHRLPGQIPLLPEDR